MAKYYPKSQITSNLYTKGGEYRIAGNSNLNESYTGFYYKVSTGKLYIGKTYSNNKQQELVPIINEESFEPSPTLLTTVDIWEGSDSLGLNPLNLSPDYEKINNEYTKLKFKNNPPPPRQMPQPGITLPGKNDEEEYTIYFAKRANTFTYMEIDKDTFTKISSQDSSIASELYSVISFPWTITSYDITINPDEINKKVVSQIERDNKWFGFSSYIQRYYFKEVQENLYTPGGQYTTQNGKNYIGFYHIHPDKGPMVGAKHIDNPHDLLFIKGQSSGSIMADFINNTTYNMSSQDNLSPSSGGGSSGGGGY